MRRRTLVRSLRTLKLVVANFMIFMLHLRAPTSTELTKEARLQSPFSCKVGPFFPRKAGRGREQKKQHRTDKNRRNRHIPELAQLFAGDGWCHLKLSYGFSSARRPSPPYKVCEVGY